MLQKFRDENALLLKSNALLNEKVKALNGQIVKALEDANEQMIVFMHTLSPSPASEMCFSSPKVLSFVHSINFKKLSGFMF